MAVLALAFAALACAPEPAPDPRAASDTTTAETVRPRVVTTSYPVDYLVRELAGDAVDLRLVLPPGGDPAHGSPDPETIVELQDADLVIGHGAGYEAWTATASLPSSKVTWTADGLDLVQTAGRTHSHGKEGEHSHGAVDPRTWRVPSLLAQQAAAVQEALVQGSPVPVLPELDDRRLDALEDRLRALDDELSEVLAEAVDRGLVFVAEDPADFAYWVRRYGIEVRSADDPALATGDLSADAVMLTFSPSDGDDPGEGPRAIQLDPLDRPAEGAAYDYEAQARANVDRLRTALAAPDTPR